jgi:hypothetical protein
LSRRDQQLNLAAAIFHVDAHLNQNCRIGRPADRGEARIGLQAINIEGDLGKRRKGRFGIIDQHLDHAANKVHLDRRVRAAFNAH